MNAPEPIIERSRASRKARRKAIPQVIAILQEMGVQVELLDRATNHHRLYCPSGWVVDFWPTTERWREPRRDQTKAVSGTGFAALLAALRKAASEDRRVA